MRQKSQIAVLLVLLLAVTQVIESKRISGRGKSSGSSHRGSSTGRRTSYSAPSSSVTKPISQSSGGSHADIAKLSYPNYNSQPNRPSSSGTGSGSVIHKPSAPEAPKPPAPGWNVPNTKPEAPAVAVNKPPSYSQANPGPPPAYSPHNTPGGARTNINEPPPAYKPNAPPPPYPINNQPVGSYPRQPTSGASNPAQPIYHANTAASHNTAYRRFGNSTGGIHTPIQPHNVNPVMGSYPHTSHTGPLPQGGVVYPAGQIPQGAVFYPQGSFPQGGVPHASYPSGGYAGYPSGGYAGYPQQGPPVFAGTGIQPGIYPASSFPAQKSSGPGLGTGLIVGALGGAVLGHALTPTHHVHQQDSTDKDRVIIINNTPGQPATVSQPGVASQPGIASQPAAAPQPVPAPAPGTTQDGIAPQPGAIPPPPAGQPAPGQPMPNVPPAGSADNTVPLAPFPPGAPGQPQQPGMQPINPPGQYSEGNVPLAPLPQNETAANTTNPGYVACFPVDVNVTDPANPSNVTTVQQIVCYNYAEPPPQPESMQQPGTQPVFPPGAQSQQQQQQPALIHTPNNNVPPQDTNAMPTQRTSTANLAANSNINSGTFSKSHASLGVIFATIAFLTISVH